MKVGFGLLCSAVFVAPFQPGDYFHEVVVFGMVWPGLVILDPYISSSRIHFLCFVNFLVVLLHEYVGLQELYGKYDSLARA